MKKILSILLCLLLATCLFVSCKSDPEPTHEHSYSFNKVTLQIECVDCPEDSVLEGTYLVIGTPSAEKKKDPYVYTWTAIEGDDLEIKAVADKCVYFVIGGKLKEVSIPNFVLPEEKAASPTMTVYLNVEVEKLINNNLQATVVCTKNGSIGMVEGCAFGSAKAGVMSLVKTTSAIFGSPNKYDDEKFGEIANKYTVFYNESKLTEQGILNYNKGLFFVEYSVAPKATDYEFDAAKRTDGEAIEHYLGVLTKPDNETYVIPLTNKITKSGDTYTETLRSGDLFNYWAFGSGESTLQATYKEIADSVGEYSFDIYYLEEGVVLTLSDSLENLFGGKTADKYTGYTKGLKISSSEKFTITEADAFELAYGKAAVTSLFYLNGKGDINKDSYFYKTFGASALADNMDQNSGYLFCSYQIDPVSEKANPTVYTLGAYTATKVYYLVEFTDAEGNTLVQPASTAYYTPQGVTDPRKKIDHYFAFGMAPSEYNTFIEPPFKSGTYSVNIFFVEDGVSCFVDSVSLVKYFGGEGAEHGDAAWDYEIPSTAVSLLKQPYSVLLPN